jgi:hypothetical protein
MSESTSFPEKLHSWDDWKRFYAVEAASKESQKSNLPGREDGPADAYRHLLWAGELTRRFGEKRARFILDAHEIEGKILGQSADAENMDRQNNELGIALGKNARAWNDVITAARTVLDRSDRSGAGGDGQATWLPATRWRKNPIDNDTKRTPKINWPDTDWVNGVQHLPYDYPFGGEEHRYSGESGSRAHEVPAFERAVETWSEEGMRHVMASKAYQQLGSPEHEIARTKVQAWFESAYGKGPAPVDATGRIITGGSTIRSSSRPARGPVHVAAHSREGGKVAVSAYDRSPPS